MFDALIVASTLRSPPIPTSPPTTNAASTLRLPPIPTPPPTTNAPVVASSLGVLLSIKIALVVLLPRLVIDCSVLVFHTVTILVLVLTETAVSVPALTPTRANCFTVALVSMGTPEIKLAAPMFSPPPIVTVPETLKFPNIPTVPLLITTVEGEPNVANVILEAATVNCEYVLAELLKLTILFLPVLLLNCITI